MEHRAAPITITKTLIGLRSAALSSHISTALPGSSCGATLGTVADLPARRLPTRCFAKLLDAPVHHQSPLALTNSPLRKLPQSLLARLGIWRASAFLYRGLR